MSSKPPAKFVKLGDRIFSWMFNRFVFIFFIPIKYLFYRHTDQNENEEVIIRFFVRLCTDVLVEVFRYGDRSRLIKLERIGRRFYLITENFFERMPILRLNLQLEPRLFFKSSASKYPKLLNSRTKVYSSFA